MRTRKTLDDTAAKIRLEYAKFLEESGRAEEHPMYTTKDALEFDLSMKKTGFDHFMKTPHSDEEIKTAVIPVRTALEVLNDEARVQRIESLMTMKHEDAMRDYLRTQKVSGIRLNEKTWTLEPADVPIDAYDFISGIYKTELNAIIDACCIFADNVAKYELSGETHITKRSLHPSYIELRKRKGWDVDKGQLSKNVLAHQMTEIVRFIAGDIGLTMLSSDVVYVKNGIIDAGDTADAAGYLIGKEERTIIRKIFRAMYTRYNGLYYEFQPKYRAQKETLTFKNNEAMAEPPVKIEKDPVSGDVVDGTADAPKKSAKKSAKKTAKNATEETTENA